MPPRTLRASRCLSEKRLRYLPNAVDYIKYDAHAVFHLCLGVVKRPGFEVVVEVLRAAPNRDVHECHAPGCCQRQVLRRVDPCQEFGDKAFMVGRTVALVKGVEFVGGLRASPE